MAGVGLALAAFASGNTSAATLHVWQDNPNPVPPYDTWVNAATNIQEAVDFAQTGDLVLVSDGVYVTGSRALPGDITNRVAIDKAITVQSVNGPAVTVIEGAPYSGGGGGGGIRCVYLGGDAVLRGFTLTNGYALSSGGGVSGGTLYNCILTGNSAGYGGGGAFGSTLHNCILTGN